MRKPAHLSPLHEHGLPAVVDWDGIASLISQLVQETLYPPEQLWLLSPDAHIRKHYIGEDKAVFVPFQDLGLLYQAVIVHTHPPNYPPTVHDVWHAIAAASPLCIVFEGNTAHLITVWHTGSPGAMAARFLLQSEEQAPALEESLHRIGGSWQQVPLPALPRALSRIRDEWYAFLRSLEGW